MKNKLIAAMVSLLLLSALGLGGCSSTQQAIERKIVVVSRGDLVGSVSFEGNLDMPRQAKLKFATSGTIKKIFVEKGQKIRAGTLLAKLDDTSQKIAVSQAQYSVELAMNELYEKVAPSIMGYPHYYPDISALLRLEQAQKELEQAQRFMRQGVYKEAAAGLRIVQYDLDASHEALTAQVIDTEIYPNIPKAINLVEQDREKLAVIFTMLEKGNNATASAELAILGDMLSRTHQVVNGVCGVIKSWGAPYPDSSTSLDSLKQVEQKLIEIQKLREQGNYDEVKVSEILRMAQHDLEMSHAILENSELTFNHGQNLKVMRQNNLNLQKAERALQSAKEELMKTEILAPFDGTVIAVDVKETDQLSPFDYSSKTAVHMVDTATVKMEGTIDEADIYKVEVGQASAIILDALPGIELKGRVTFVSPFGVKDSGVIKFPVTIAFEPTKVELKGGLTATADITVEERKNVLLVPNGAVKVSSEGYWVEVVTGNAPGDTERRQVISGTQNGRFTEILSGLKENEKVIVEKVRP